MAVAAEIATRNPYPNPRPIERDAIRGLIAERATARKAKQWAEADRIRNLLQEGGVVLEDTPKGTTWRRD